MNKLHLIGVPLLLMGVIQFFFGVYCVLKVSKKNLASLYVAGFVFATGFFCSTISLSYIRAGLGLDYSLYYRAGWIGYFAIPFWFSLFYELRGKHRPIQKWAIFMLYPFWTIVNYFNLTTNLIDIEPASFIPYSDQGGPLEIPTRWFANLQLVLVITLIVRLRMESIGYRRQQLSYLLLGTFIYVVGGILIAGAPSGKLHYDPGLTGFCGLPWIALTSYAILRHRLFDVRLVASRILSTGVLIAAFGLLTYFLIIEFRKIVGNEMGIFLGSLLSMIFAFASPIPALIRRKIDQLVLKRTFDHQAALRKSSEALVSIFNLDDLLRKFCDIARQSVGVKNAGFFLLHKDRYELRCLLGAGKIDEKSAILQPENYVPNRIAQQKHALIRDEQLNVLSEEELSLIQKELSIASGEAAVPVIYKDTMTGFLVLGHKSNREPFLQEDIDFLETLSSQAAVAIENSRLFEDASTDGLTGLYRQKYFKNRLKVDFERARRHGKPLIILMIDIDFFKKINDIHGHLIGDTVLKSVAESIREALRIEDLVSRYGGEEFAVILSETSTEKVIEVAERVRKKVEEAQFVPDLNVTVSIGVYIMEQNNDRSEVEVLEKADKALYKAKNGGRNRVVFYERNWG